jgi:hypothetical protein
VSSLFGNAEIQTADLLHLAALIGPAGENDDDPDSLYFQCERATYTRAEVIELLQLFVKVAPDECTVEDNGELRLWWD